MFRIINASNLGQGKIKVEFANRCRIMLYDFVGKLQYATYGDSFECNYSDNIKTLVWYYDKCHYGTIGLNK